MAQLRGRVKGEEASGEPFVFDVVGRDPARLSALWDDLARRGEFDLSGTAAWREVEAAGFVSGRSTHADRLATIRAIDRRYGRMVDPHTADGLKVGLEHRERGVPLLCVETALPAKFAATIREALGREPGRPRAFDGLEERPQYRTLMANDADAVRSYVASHAQAAD